MTLGGVIVVYTILGLPIRSMGLMENVVKEIIGKEEETGNWNAARIDIKDIGTFQKEIVGFGTENWQRMDLRAFGRCQCRIYEQNNGGYCLENLNHPHRENEGAR